ncbi:DUF4442 domain-containing protein [Gaetbulibacter saemankumensis]|uniref:DUF4442 domain-containing protein n=1 Tax=Gaetbulibacter saemankumensis TaxID=311208 RepID=UPI000480F1D7|nr:DUF4442 domain-containing protein [Gaetbulibacter saemankumensis]
MSITPSKLNYYMMFKVPAAYFCGVRTKSISDVSCIVSVKHRWINQNPFKSMFWAVQGMAAEFTTGALMADKIKNSGKRFSMLIVSNKAVFSKKATGRITFSCNEGLNINEAILKAIRTGEGETVWVKAEGKDEAGDTVSTFHFEWSLKLKS